MEEQIGTGIGIVAGLLILAVFGGIIGASVPALVGAVLVLLVVKAIKRA